MDDNDTTQYREFLKSLDDSQFLSFVLSIRSQDNENVPKPAANSTPNPSQLSDPFSDTLDLLLENQANIPKPSTQKSVDTPGEVPSETNPKDPPVEPDFLSQISLGYDHDNTFSSDEEEVGPKHDFGEYDVYFRNKQMKQQQSDEAYKQWDMERRQFLGQSGYQEPIFKNCVIHVNGHTVPSLPEIHRLVVIHGGKFLAFLNNKSAATHIICDRLTPRKEQIFKNCKVVKAQWIVDSVESKKLLDWKIYRLFKEVRYDQQRLNFRDNDSFAIEQYNNEDIVEEDDEDLLGDRYELEQADRFQDEESLNAEADLVEDDVAEAIVVNVGSRLGNVGKTSIMTAKDPDFLPHFFANSRLHHLSSWKADLRATFLKRVASVSKKKGYSMKTNRTIMHIDFDCFFATASAQKHTELDMEKDPIVVSHGNNTSDVASCNYVARKYGVRNGMWIRSARRVCPDIKIIDYEFDLYEKYASSLYNYLVTRSDDFDLIYPVLVDEALVDITSYANEKDHADHLESFCREIRQDIYNLTRCSASVGIGSNVLLAKLALKKAKPNGYYILNDDIDTYLRTVPVRDLPGVGYALVEKIQKELGTNDKPVLGDIQGLPLTRMMNVFGPKTGKKLHDYARGIDNTSIELDHSSSVALLGRKSVSVDVNFGIRFDTHLEVEKFMSSMSQEVSKRLKNLEVVGSQVTLRLARRAPSAPVNPPKYLGMGECIFLNKSSKLGMSTNEAGIISAELKSLTRILDIPPAELRGVAVTVSKLEDEKEAKKLKQQKLPQGAITRSKTKREVAQIDTSNFKDPIEGLTEIDWEVFDALPWAIKKELRDELSRRGLVSRNSSPKKGEKVYLQQLLPSGNGHEPKYVRIIESPKKSKLKSRTSSPQKQGSVPPARELDESYDSSVLNELPSSLREEVLEERKRQKIEPVFLRDKFLKISEQNKDVLQEITADWTGKQEILNPPPEFLDKRYMYSDMINMIEGWVSDSIEQEGPHEDDVNVFTNYLSKLLQQNNLTRTVNLALRIKKELDYHRALQICSPTMTLAFKEWDNVLQRIDRVIEAYCKLHKKALTLN